MIEAQLITALLMVAIILTSGILIMRSFAFNEANIAPLSPFIIFYLAVILGFVLRPLVDLYSGLRYEFTTFNLSIFIVSQSLSCLSCFSYFLGYICGGSRSSFPERLSLSSEVENVAAFRTISWCVSIGFSLVFIGYLYSKGISFYSLLGNRENYLSALAGNGHVFLINSFSTIFIGFGLAASVYGHRVGLLGWLGLAIFCVGNILVTNRNAIAATFGSLIFAYLLRGQKERKNIPVALTIFVMAFIGGLGGLLGLIRNAESQSPFKSFQFLLLTFDMSELFQETLLKMTRYEWGIPWVEDLIYTYLPRAFFPSKPVVYGVTRTQDLIMPFLTREGEAFTATFPIGSHGEAFINFGIMGVIIGFGVLGLFHAYIYTKLIQTRELKPFFLWVPVLFVLYTSFCLNPLSYMRSFGSFIVALFFVFFQCIAAIFTIIILMRFTHHFEKQKPH